MAEDLECVLNRWKPAQTLIIYDYSTLGVAAQATVTYDISLGSKSFDVGQPLLPFGDNMRVRVSALTSPFGAWMEGPITSYVDTTLVVDVDTTSAVLGTFSSWSIKSLALQGAGGSMAGTP